MQSPNKHEFVETTCRDRASRLLLEDETGKSPEEKSKLAFLLLLRMGNSSQTKDCLGSAAVDEDENLLGLVSDEEGAKNPLMLSLTNRCCESEGAAMASPALNRT